MAPVTTKNAVEKGGAEGGIRPGVFLGVPGRPSCGLQSHFAFVYVCDCSPMVAGIPVNFPVKTGMYQLS